jgi:bacterioferritin-associated ferredoxin
MYVCICRGITDSQIRRAVDQGVASLSQLRRELSVAACCGRCAPMAREIIREQSQPPANCAQALSASA